MNDPFRCAWLWEDPKVDATREWYAVIGVENIDVFARNGGPKYDSHCARQRDRAIPIVPVR